VQTGAGNDSVAYTYGVDRYPVQIDVGTGNDTVYWFGTQPSEASLVRIWGREGDDEVQASRADPLEVVWFRGGRGDDLTKGVTRSQGGRGDDTLAAQAYPPAPPTSLRGGPGRDRLSGERADDELRGGPGADQLKDHGGDDVVYGGGGSDVIAVDDGGHDDVNCGPGVDSVLTDWRDFVVSCETTAKGTRRGFAG
jgi:Ca2+-binding RTX toxin-like protein